MGKARNIYDFKGRRALITGSTSGIGFAIARRLAAGGADIILNYQQDDDHAGEAVREIKAMGVKCAGIRADISIPEECRRLAKEAIHDLSGLDFLVHCAGPFAMGSIADMPETNYQYIVDANFTSAFHLTQECIPSLRKSKNGNIVFIGGVNSGSFTVKANMAAYYSAKAALVVFMRTVAVEEAPNGIRANMVSPGFIDNGSYTDEFKEKSIGEIPLGRFGEPDDVAAPVAWLLTEDAGYVTGSIIDAGGGLWM
jgi:NAD(P)-dependent dehydrogenase (short-subunit alcohol dehydrogenase family)